MGTYTGCVWCLIKTDWGGGGAFAALCLEKYANINKNTLKKHTKSCWRLRCTWGGLNNPGDGYDWHFPEIIKRSKTQQLPLLNLCKAQIDEYANESCRLLMLKTGNKFALQLHPYTWRLIQISFLLTSVTTRKINLLSNCGFADWACEKQAARLCHARWVIRLWRGGERHTKNTADSGDYPFKRRPEWIRTGLIVCICYEITKEEVYCTAGGGGCGSSWKDG